MLNFIKIFLSWFSKFNIFSAFEYETPKSDIEAFETDCSALRSDWEKVGEDLKKVINAHKDGCYEQETEKTDNN